VTCRRWNELFTRPSEFMEALKTAQEKIFVLYKFTLAVGHLILFLLARTTLRRLEVASRSGVKVWYIKAVDLN